jgi:hypothetical protein
MVVFAVTEHSTFEEVVASLRTFVGGSKTIAYSELETGGIEAEGCAALETGGIEAEGCAADEPFEPAELPGAGSAEADDELAAGLLAGAGALAGPADLFRIKAPAINPNPRIPDKSRTGVFETGESTSATKILKLPPVTAISSRTAPSTSKPITTLWGMGRPFQSNCPGRDSLTEDRDLKK